MWMKAFRERRALSFLKRTFLDQGRPLDSNNSDTRFQHTHYKGTRPQHRPIGRKDITFTLDINFCSCCHEYRTGRTISRRPLFITISVPVTLLILLSLLTNSCYANAQPPPLSTAVTQTPDPGIFTSTILSHYEEKSKNVKSQSQERTIPGAPYYEFFINEASYKFWAVFQLTTVFILLYSAFAAIYYAKYTFLTEIETLKDEDIILRRRRQLSSKTAQEIVKATTTLLPTLRFKDTTSRSRVHR